MKLVNQKYYVTDRQLGQGSFSTVFLGSRLYDSLPVAVKVVHCTSLTNSRIVREIQCLESLQHPHILSIHDWALEEEGSEQTYYLFLELCRGSLTSLSLPEEPAEKEKRVQSLMCQIHSATVYLQSRGYCHRDLKPSNILIGTGEGDPVLKLADFGLVTEEQVGLQTVCGSPLYMAPEVLHCREYDNTADLWSVGMILYGLLYGSLPHYGKDVNTIRRLVRDLDVSQFPIQYSQQVEDLLHRLLKKDPGERMSWSEYRSHPWFTEKVSSPIAVVEKESKLHQSQSLPYYIAHSSQRIPADSTSPLGWSNLSRIRKRITSNPETYDGFQYIV